MDFKFVTVTADTVLGENDEFDKSFFEYLDEYSISHKILEKNEGVLVPELIWDSQKFLTKKSQLVVFCSTNYDHDDYIFDFNKFIKIKKEFTNFN